MPEFFLSQVGNWKKKKTKWLEKRFAYDLQNAVYSSGNVSGSQYVSFISNMWPAL